MALLDDILAALKAGAEAGAAAASTAGKDLRQDVDNFLIPHLKDCGIHIASIVAKREAGTYTDTTARLLLESQMDAIKVLVETMLTLTALQAQQILNAIISALTTAIDAALGFALLA
jgi:hypothetical protein